MWFGLSKRQMTHWRVQLRRTGKSTRSREPSGKSLVIRKGHVHARMCLAMVLDDLDGRILQELQRDGRASHRTLATRLGTTTPTIGARLRRLEETGVLQGTTPTLAPNAISGTLWTLLIKAPATTHHAIIDDLHADADVERVYVLSGGRIFVQVRPATPQAIGKLESRLAELGATSHDAWAVTNIALDRQPDLERHAAVATCAQCRGPIHGNGESANLDKRRIWFCCGQCKSAFVQKHERLAKAR